MELQFALGLFLSALIGLSLGLIGGGGSIITVPVLVYVLGVAPYDAVGMSLAVVGGTSLVGAFMHNRRGSLEFKTGVIFGISGIVGALAGSPLTKLLSPSALMMTFALLMLVVAILMIKRESPDAAEVNELRSDLNVWKALLAGFGVGVMTGFLGVGGGFLIVPALVMFGGLRMKKAVGTSLLIIFLNCVAGLVGHASQNNFDWKLTGMVTLLAVSGAIAGTLLSQKIEANKLQKSFAVFVLLTAVFLMVKNYGVIFGG